MLASTIAEIFSEDDGIVVELEIGGKDPVAFGSLMPGATWVARASLGHWGHIHQRQNRYRAALDVRPMDGAWKLVDVDIQEDVRL